MFKQGDIITSSEYPGHVGRYLYTRQVYRKGPQIVADWKPGTNIKANVPVFQAGCWPESASLFSSGE